MIERRFTVAIDGPAAAGKGTISRAVAAHFGFAYLDTGLLYRAVGLKTAAQGEISPKAATEVAEALTVDDLKIDGLRSASAAEAASKVAAFAPVRAALLQFQRDFADQKGGAVLDGRDIGTIVCPTADVKLFVTARDEIRAKRRHLELQQSGSTQSIDSVLADVRARDHRDANRRTAPMKPAADALLLDTSELSIDAAVTEAVTNIKRIIEGRD